MKHKHRITPNPLTYSALIDVCGRCQRSDLALKALRLMLRDEQLQRRKLRAQRQHEDKVRIAMSEQTVGAWTATINACGKTGRIETAIKLFFVSMPQFDVKPNIVTCGALLDALLKNGRTNIALDVLRYMTTHNIEPSKYMYTSLMTYASRLAQLDTNFQGNHDNDDDVTTGNNRPWSSLLDEADDANTVSNTNADNNDGDGRNESPLSEIEDSMAVQIYSELMSTLITKSSFGTGRKPRSSLPSSTQPGNKKNINNTKKTREGGNTSNSSDELYQVSMVFREMKASGLIPDIGSYNMLLRSCANAGDIDRAMEVFNDIRTQQQGQQVTMMNDRTWRVLLRAAGKAKRSDMVIKIWKLAIKDIDADHSDQTRDKPLSGAAAVLLAKKKQKAMNKKKKRTYPLSIKTFSAFLTGLLICASDLRKSGDHHTSAELYRIVIKCYNSLRSMELLPPPAALKLDLSPSTATKITPEKSNEKSMLLPAASEAVLSISEKVSTYMGMNLIDAQHGGDDIGATGPITISNNPQIKALTLQAVTNLISLLDNDEDMINNDSDQDFKLQLKQLGVSIAKSNCFNRNYKSANDKSSSVKPSNQDKTQPTERSTPTSSTTTSPRSSAPSLTYFDKKALSVARTWY